MELKPYKELVALTKEKLDAAMLPLTVRKAKAKAEVRSSEIEQEMLELESEINEMCAGKDFDFDKIIDKMNSYDLKERKLKQVTKLVDQLFPE